MSVFSYDVYFKSTITGKIITYPYDLDTIYGDGAVERAIHGKILEKLDPTPTVIDCLKYGSKLIAIKRYREIHGTTLKEARDMVEKIMDDIGMPRY